MNVRCVCSTMCADNATGHNKASSHGVASHTKPTPHYQQLHSDSAFVGEFSVHCVFFLQTALVCGVSIV